MANNINPLWPTPEENEFTGRTSGVDREARRPTMENGQEFR